LKEKLILNAVLWEPGDARLVSCMYLKGLWLSLTWLLTPSMLAKQYWGRTFLFSGSREPVCCKTIFCWSINVSQWPEKLLPEYCKALTFPCSPCMQCHPPELVAMETILVPEIIYSPPSFPLRFSRKRSSSGESEEGGCVKRSCADKRGAVKKREGYLQWEEYFMAVAFLSAQRSKDPSSQVRILPHTLSFVLIPRPTPFSVLWLALTVIHGKQVMQWFYDSLQIQNYKV